MQSLNIIYIIEQALGFTGSVNSAGFQSQVAAFMGTVEWIAVGFSILCILVFIFEYLKLATVEARFHRKRLDAEIAAAGTRTASPLNLRWEHIVGLANSSNENDRRRAILDADQMLRELLVDRGFVGEDIGEQLKGASRDHFATLGDAWEAHKTRNMIAHLGAGYELNARDTLATLDQYRRVFEEFKYI